MSQQKAFNLTRWFSIFSFLCISITGALNAQILSKFLTDRMLQREGELTMELVERIARTEGIDGLFLSGAAESRDVRFAGFFAQLASMPGVLRANIYDRQAFLVWSSESALTGKHFPDNPELDKALTGQLAVHFGRVGESNKPEHARLDDRLYYVETYVPVYDGEREVVGAVEVYRIPARLLAAIQDGQRLVWLSAVFAGLALFFTLVGLARRADAVIRDQNRRLLETETAVATMEIASAVAHSIRNPLAVIRASAEVQAYSAAPEATESMHDIMSSVDRVEALVRDLLRYSRPVIGGSERASVSEIIECTLLCFAAEFGRRGVRVNREFDPALPQVSGSLTVLGQAFDSLVSNALESMPKGGELTIRARQAQDARNVEVTVADTGCGISPQHLDQVFKPFFTTKARGLGVGLALTQKIIRRYGGDIRLTSRRGEGTTATVKLRMAT